MIAEKLTHYYPGAKWNMTGGTYDKLEWFGPGEKPTEAEIAGLPDLTETLLAARAAAQRKAERTQPEKLAAALEVIAKQVVKPALVNLSEADILAVSVMFPDWEVGAKYLTGDVVNYNGEPVEILQPHTSQADWLPPDVPALYKRFIADGQVTAWVQPQGANDAYQIGQQVTHNGQTWESTSADNVWEPGVYGWTVV